METTTIRNGSRCCSEKRGLQSLEKQNRFEPWGMRRGSGSMSIKGTKKTKQTKETKETKEKKKTKKTKGAKEDKGCCNDKV